MYTSNSQICKLFLSIIFFLIFHLLCILAISFWSLRCEAAASKKFLHFPTPLRFQILMEHFLNIKFKGSRVTRIITNFKIFAELQNLRRWVCPGPFSTPLPLELVLKLGQRPWERVTARLSLGCWKLLHRKLVKIGTYTQKSDHKPRGTNLPVRDS